MNSLLEKFKQDYLESLLDFLWREWSSLGVSGYQQSESNRVIDPEALLIFSCTMARYDARLFDEILNWLDMHGHCINIQRLKRIQKTEIFNSTQVLAAIAGLMTDRGKISKWKRLSFYERKNDVQEDLFLNKEGSSIQPFGESDPIFYQYGLQRGKLQFREQIQPIRILQPKNLWYRLRALWGVNARAEIMLYLLTHESGHPHGIARETYFFQKTIQDALVDMAKSGVVYISQRGREKHYRIKREQWFNLLNNQVYNPEWCTWAPLFSVFDQIWHLINHEKFLNSDSLAQSSELRQSMKKNRQRIEKSGFGRVLSNEDLYLGEDYIPVFISDVSGLLKVI